MTGQATTPLQTDRNCVAYAYAFAIEHLLLRDFGPEYHTTIDRAAVEKITGAPTLTTSAGTALNQVWPWVTVLNLDDNSALSAKEVVVVSTWRDGIAHAVTIFENVMEYDPGKGVVQPTYGTNKMARRVLVQLRNPPIINKWRRYALYRWLESLFN